MDFSSHNPNTSNALSLAARANNVPAVSRLIKKINPNCIDNRGWTCLHEAANSDSYESLLVILNNPKCRFLAETHEGHTALYLACRRKCSLKTIEALLSHIPDIANYGSTENVTPLHVASGQGRVELIQLLLNYGAMIDVQDFDGDTPLHDAAAITLKTQYEAVNVLLHAGANPGIKNESSLLTPFHIACLKGCHKTIECIYPFITNIDQVASGDETPLMLGVRGGSEEVVTFLLEHKADPHLTNAKDQSALDIALSLGYPAIFKILLAVTERIYMNPLIILEACKPHYFKFDILQALLCTDLGPEFYDFIETFHVFLEDIGGIRPVYLTNAPLNSFLNICEYIFNRSVEKFREFFYLFLMRGVSVDAVNIHECPPLVYIHYCMHSSCFREVFQILIENNCNVDYCSTASRSSVQCMPDSFIASMSSDPETLPLMLPYSLLCEPMELLTFAFDNGIFNRISMQVHQQLILMNDENHSESYHSSNLLYFVPSLKQCCRLTIRSVFRQNRHFKKSSQVFELFQHLPLPLPLKQYIQYF